MAMGSFCFIVVSLSGVRPLLAAETQQSCGNVLLQSRQAVERVEVLRDQEAPHAAGWLGWGRWVGQEDLWHMQNMHGESLFARHMPGACFEEAACRHAHAFQAHNFESVESWSSYLSTTFGLGISGGYGGFTASIDASMGSNAGSSGSVSKRFSYAVKSLQRKCYRLIRDKFCAYNMSNLQPALLQRLSSLPLGSPYTAEKMEAWKSAFVQRFGTHLTLGSSHGALVQSLASVDASSELNSDCMSAGMCLKFGWIGAGSAGLSLCSNSSRCDNSSKASESQRSTCVAIGGDPALQSQVCQASVTQDDVDLWLQGGDVEAGSSAYRYSFMPISDFLTNVNFTRFYKAALTLEKAVEYSNCRLGKTPPEYAWEDSTCKCVRQCQNGGVLDPSTCTCKCRGNAKQGWTGPGCTETYGSCQPGVGTGNPGAARRCPVAGKCASWTDSHVCKPTDVCCATNFGTTCCPFGSSCRCGGSSCSCRAN